MVKPLAKALPVAMVEMQIPSAPTLGAETRSTATLETLILSAATLAVGIHSAMMLAALIPTEAKSAALLALLMAGIAAAAELTTEIPSTATLGIRISSAASCSTTTAARGDFPRSPPRRAPIRDRKKEKQPKTLCVKKPGQHPPKIF